MKKVFQTLGLLSTLSLSPSWLWANTEGAIHQPIDIQLVDQPTVIVLSQRHSTSIPGSDQQIKISLGDITMGQVAVSIYTHDANYNTLYFVESKSMTQGQSVQFRLPNQKVFELTVVLLVNQLIGEDTAKLEIKQVSAKPSTTEQPI